MLCIANMQPHRAVDAGTAVPAGIGQLGVVCHHGEGIFRAVVQAGQFYGKGGITILVTTNHISVQRNGTVLIHALKFYQNLLAFPLSRGSEGFFIGVDTAGEIAVTAVRNRGVSLFQNLRVMGQGHRCAVADPMLMKADLFHRFILQSSFPERLSFPWGNVFAFFYPRQ